jgi:hypothetical protein
MIQSRQVDGLVAVATWGRGVFTTNLTTLDVASESGSSEGMMAMQSYPDPVRTTATIRFIVPGHAGGSAVQLDLFNAIGEKVANLVDDRLAPGEHAATLDLAKIPPSQMPDGAYYCRLQCGDLVETRRVTVLR